MAENRGPESFHTQNLQQDAIRRAREMQARAHLAPPSSSYSAPPQKEPQEPSTGTPSPHMEQMPIHPRSESGSPGLPVSKRQEAPSGMFGGALDFLTKDSERTLILILMLILLEEKTNAELIFALLYMLL